MVARRCSFRSFTSRMVNMSSMLPILSLMLSEAGASLIGQLAVDGAAARQGSREQGLLLRLKGSSGQGMGVRLGRRCRLWWQEPQGPQVHFHAQKMLAGL